MIAPRSFLAFLYEKRHENKGHFPSLKRGARALQFTFVSQPA
jgi:hypothetical protein